jgi:hypothetical protein
MGNCHYISRHDEAALAALVRRHGPMVRGAASQKKVHGGEYHFKVILKTHPEPRLVRHVEYRAMAQPVLENVCKVTDRGPRNPHAMFWTGWTEIVIEASKKLGELLGDQVQAELKAIEVSFQLLLARDPQEIHSGVGAFWQRSFDCLCPMIEAQIQATQFAAALSLHVAGGMKTVSEEVYRRRLAVCEVCEFFRDNHCLQCGCRMAGDVVAKARWTNEQCPLGKWDITIVARDPSAEGHAFGRKCACASS